MEVSDTQELGNDHKIEVGGSTWEPREPSVRSRYPTSNGGFNPRSSPETPVRDLVPMIDLVAKHDMLTVNECATIIAVLSASIARRT